MTTTSEGDKKLVSAPELKELARTSSALATPAAKGRVHYPAEIQSNTEEHIHHGIPSAGLLTADMAYSQQENSAPHLSRSASPSIIDLVDDEEHYEAEDYDWSGDDDLVDEELKFDEKVRNSRADKEHNGWSFKRIITLLFSSFLGSLLLAILLATPAILFQYLWYKPYPTEDRAYVNDNISAWLYWASANMLVSWALAFVGKVLVCSLNGWILRKHFIYS